MSEDELLLHKLDELIAATKAASVPVNLRWLDADQIGAMLGFSGTQIMQRIACRPDFPAALRIGGSGHPRWLASEVAEWARREREQHESSGKRRRAA